ncbi:hypothetical protein IJH15_03670 [Candidatus Saccharibacteria bacterium]|nr:hypothetical protein [Candidatus Saccharibacteria bacterium]
MKKGLMILGLFILAAVLTFFSLKNVFAEESEFINSDLFIKAVNPGYTIDGKSNVGEMIEISRKKSDELVSLAGITVGYTNSSGNYSTLFEFPENSFMAGETVLLRLASSPESELAAVNYTKTLAFKAGITLERDGKVLDGVCWTGREECLREFKSSNPTTLVRNDETGEFEHLEKYDPVYDKDSYYVLADEEEVKPSQCKGLEFSEILSYYENSKDEQFIELYNSSSEQILINGCKIKYKNKTYELNGVIRAESYNVYYPKEFSLTKNPTNVNALELIDTNGTTIHKMEYPNGQRKGTAYARIGYDGSGKEIWRVTYAPTPGEPNNYQEFKTCEAGKVLNEATGNCVKVTSVTERICGEGQYLNILTGRCNKIKTTSEKTCKEGYYYNPDTNRCRKITENKGAEYSIEPENYEEKTSFIALYAIIGVLVLGISYLIFEFRQEIGKLFRKVFRRSP